MTFGAFEWQEHVEQRALFWKDVAATTGECCVWFSRKSASDYCGYLEWASGNKNKPHRVVEVDSPVERVNLLPEWLMYFSRSQLADSAQQQADARAWKRLISEGAPVRKIEKGKVLSATLDCFDSLLLIRATTEWKSAALIVGEVLANDFEDIHQAGDLLLVSRIWALVDDGKLDSSGDQNSIRSVRVRLKPV